MPYLAFVLTSAAGAGALVWHGWRRHWWRAGLVVLGATAVAVAYWLVAIPRTGDSPSLTPAVAALLAAIVLPGGAGAAVTYAGKTRATLIGGLLLALALWLPLTYVGFFSVCQVDTACNL